MKWDAVGEMNCSVARTLSLVGDRWTMLILRSNFMGVRRFDDFHTLLGMTRHVLTDRLNRLVEAEVLKKVPYQEKPARFEYRLTDKGKDLYPVVLSLMAWGDKWMDKGLGAPLHLQHSTCGHTMTPLMVCSECREPLHPREVAMLAGPGLTAVPAK
jgi:DNA-binding HxlR family transcriptional regulator